ncbi:hypothetical protein U27_00820 [Candidatus Vecturithrix granuli]|uniref:Phosphatidylglycerol lysyltransferase n=1 Tax=Vecturithrix granuli TaxID=1499967 RepID=A0A081C8L7_VECG1|nr:hypothetical protein U27_00820 [Candidatus Vecturithrix granuli]
MKKKLMQWLSLAIFAAALWLLYHELKAYHYHDIFRQIKNLSAAKILAAFVLMLGGYTMMTGYDLLAIRYLGHALRRTQVMFTAFIVYALGNTISHPVVTSALRYRLYSLLGLSAIEVAQLVAFCGATFWLGILALGGFIFTFAPPVLPASFSVHGLSTRGLGAIFLLVLSSYVAGVWLYKRRLTIANWEFALPAPPIALGQILASSLDWVCASGTFYVLLPAHQAISYPHFLGLFLLAYTLSILSQVPGGVGVLETLLIVLLKPYLPADAVLGAILVYRVIYYLFPLAIAGILLTGQEFRRRQTALQQTFELVNRWLSPIIPELFAAMIFLGGIILLFSGATPPVGSRFEVLKDLLPLPVIELSHFLGSIAGVGLLLLARGLQRRLDGAYVLTMILLGAGTVFSVLKGFDYEEALILTLMLFALFLCRTQFYRQTSFLNERFTPGWGIAIAGVLVCSLWLGFFAHKHVTYAHELWWQFSLHGNAPRALRASVGAIIVVGCLAFVKLLRPVAPPPVSVSPEDLSKIRSLVSTSPRSEAHLALLGDKRFLLSPQATAFIMYGVEGQNWIALGDPIGAESEYAELVWQFRELCDRHDGWPVFHEVSTRYLPLYIDQGLTLLKLGEDARVPLATFSLEGSQHKSQRYIVRKFEKEGSQFEVLPADAVAALLPELQRISDDWLARKNTSEKRFSLGFFNPEYLMQTPLGIVHHQGNIVAFANLWCSGQQAELSIDLMRYTSEAPANVMEYLFVQLMLWGKQQGYAWFSLGMAPLSGIENRIAAPLWNRVSNLLFQHGEHFYNFQGLRQYKEKFDPVWEPKYLASPGGIRLPQVLAGLSALISGGMKGVLTK